MIQEFCFGGGKSGIWRSYSFKLKDYSKTNPTFESPSLPNLLENSQKSDMPNLHEEVMYALALVLGYGCTTIKTTSDESLYNVLNDPPLKPLTYIPPLARHRQRTRLPRSLPAEHPRPLRTRHYHYLTIATYLVMRQALFTSSPLPLSGIKCERAPQRALGVGDQIIDIGYEEVSEHTRPAR
ncbi:hypothetical protein BDP27DRAFT_1362746 [Rhodocollybia butyracea]|uniref:Uncharacterized protein n=1 Tax=Rhodocollybia butyracea TaxID=206335 RepID=A0A9P5PW89_9AGAR|nr:hypothetical protein BDP27DRAFT_1362746 [Rhodocollybia butyracea]